MNKYLSGEALYGDAFGLPELTEWYRDEEEAYYELTLSEVGGYKYAYHAMNLHYAYSKLQGRSFGLCLAFGCAAGDDVAPLAGQVTEFLCVEPCERFWHNKVGDKRARFLKPAVTGEVPLPDRSADLVVCLSVLHHIPNVSFILTEFARVLAPRGILVLREPVISMGDWSRLRPGLTKHERGIPVSYLRARLQNLGLAVLSETLCGFPLIPRVGKLLGVPHAYNSRALVWLDHALSFLMQWNLHYHRDSVWKKFAPSQISIVARNQANS